MLYIFRYGTCTLIVVCRALLLRVVRFFLAVPAKKHLLMKWEKSHSGQENVCGSAVPPTRPHPPPKGGDRNSSPLFDEVSSEGEDFEVADRGGSRRHALGLSSSDVRRRSHSQTAAAQAFPPPKDSDPPLHAPDVVHVGNEEEESVVVVVGPRTPLGNDDCSMDSCYSRPTDEDDANNSLDSSVVAGKADVDYHRGACGEVGPRTPPPLPVDGVAVARQTADSCEGTRALGPSLSTRPAGRDSVDEGEAGGGGYDGTSDANKSDLFEGGSECSFRQDEDSPMSPHNKSGNQGGKKKVCPPTTLPSPPPSLHPSRFLYSVVQFCHPLAHFERVVVRLGEWGEERRGWGGGNGFGG